MAKITLTFEDIPEVDGRNVRIARESSEVFPMDPNQNTDAQKIVIAICKMLQQNGSYSNNPYAVPQPGTK